MDGQPRFVGVMQAVVATEQNREQEHRIPAGRVAERIQRFSKDSNSNRSRTSQSASGASAHRAPSRAPFRSRLGSEAHAKAVQISTVTYSQGDSTPRSSADSVSSSQARKINAPPDNIQTANEDERGRSQFNNSIAEILARQDTDDVMHDVRARLVSLQSMVSNKKQNGSPAREEMLDELGEMLDDAILTTMSSPTRSTTISRSTSTRRARNTELEGRSPTKGCQQDKSSSQHAQPYEISRTGMDSNDEVSRPSMVAGQHTGLEERAEAMSVALHCLSPITELSSTDSQDESTIISREGNILPSFSQRRGRQASEPVSIHHRPTGFPLVSPVRERAMQWESMRNCHSGQEDNKSPMSRAPDQVESQLRSQTSNESTVPIPLTLPLLVEAEKRREMAGLSVENDMHDQENPFIQSSSPTNLRRSSSHWTKRMREGDLGSGLPVAETSDILAQASEHQDHHARHRPSIVKTKIKDLLAATRRKISSESNERAQGSEAGDLIPHETAPKRAESIEPVPKVVEPKRVDTANVPDRLAQSSGKTSSRASVYDLAELDPRNLPELQAPPEGISCEPTSKIPSTDGTCTLSFDVDPSLIQWRPTPSSRIRSNYSSISRTASGCMAPLSTTDRADLRDKRPASNAATSGSPAKTGSRTPERGYLRTHSPGGRPFHLEKHMQLSPSRSNSRGSRGGITFNIKARISPGRSKGSNDDTDLFVTADVESETSEEEH